MPDPKPMPTIDILILRALYDEHQTTAISIAKVLGEHHSRVTEWCEKFVKMGLAERYVAHLGRNRENTTLYCPVRKAIAAHLESKKSDKRSA